VLCTTVDRFTTEGQLTLDLETSQLVGIVSHPDKNERYNDTTDLQMLVIIAKMARQMLSVVTTYQNSNNHWKKSFPPI